MNRDSFQQQQQFLNNSLSGKTIMVSGSTGLIGSSIVRYLHNLNLAFDSGIKIVGLYRNDAKKDKMYPETTRDITFAKLTEEGVEAGIQIDYFIHAAGISGGTKMHLKDPLQIFATGIDGTKKVLDYSVCHGCKGFCYVSTYEVYGAVNSEALINEDQDCKLNPLILRNSYAEVKRCCESMLTAYHAAYGLTVYSGRLTSTFGTGVSYNDPRFFAEFARCAIEGRDIVLKSSGGTVRNYLDSDDAASAFLYILVNGENENAYNLTNMDNAFSIKEIAEKIIRISKAPIQLKFDIAEDIKTLGFRKEGCTLMDASKLEGIGWKPVYSLDDTIEKMLFSMKR